MKCGTPQSSTTDIFQHQGQRSTKCVTRYKMLLSAQNVTCYTAGISYTYTVNTGRPIRTYDTNHNIEALPKRPIRNNAQGQRRDLDREIYGYQSGNCEKSPSSVL